MFLRTSTYKSTENSLRQIEQLQNLPPAASFACYGKLKSALDKADAVVIGAGAGLSTSAGFVYNGERFKKYFSDFEAKFSFHDMYSGGFYPYDTLEEHWAYWSRYIPSGR